MKISRAIMELQSLAATHGDIEICLNTDQAYRDFDGSFIPVFGFYTEKIHQGKGEDSDETEESIIAVLDFHKSFIHEHE